MPNNERKKPRVPKKARVLEAVVQRSCLKYLKDKGLMHFRMNSGAFKNSQGRMFFFGEKGMADILVFFPPLATVAFEKGGGETVITRHRAPLWIECKSSVGYQSPDQKVFEQRVTGEGHRYEVVRDVKALVDIVEGHFKHGSY